MRNVPLKGFQTYNSRKSPLRKFFTNPFTKGDKDDINAPMELVKEEKQLEDNTKNDGVSCIAENGGMVRNEDKPNPNYSGGPRRDGY